MKKLKKRNTEPQKQRNKEMEKNPERNETKTNKQRKK